MVVLLRKRKVEKMSEKRCAICGTTKDLVLHHMDAVHGQLLPDAVVWLCRRHHAQIHAKRDSRFFKLEEAVKEFQRRLRKNDKHNMRCKT